VRRRSVPARCPHSNVSHGRRDRTPGAFTSPFLPGTPVSSSASAAAPARPSRQCPCLLTSETRTTCPSSRSPPRRERCSSSEPAALSEAGLYASARGQSRRTSRPSPTVRLTPWIELGRRAGKKAALIQSPGLCRNKCLRICRPPLSADQPFQQRVGLARGPSARPTPRGRCPRGSTRMMVKKMAHRTPIRPR